MESLIEHLIRQMRLEGVPASYDVASSALMIENEYGELVAIAAPHEVIAESIRYMQRAFGGTDLVSECRAIGALAAMFVGEPLRKAYGPYVLSPTGLVVRSAEAPSIPDPFGDD